MATTKTYYIQNTADDGYISNGYFNVSTVQMGNNNGNASNVYFRFGNIDIPKNATITDAYLHYRTQSADSSQCNVRIYGNNVDNAISPTSVAEYNSKVLTTAYVDWTPETFPLWEWLTSVQIKTIIQEIVNRTGWVSNNAILLLIKDNGSPINGRRAISDYSNNAITELVITYNEPVTSTNADVTVPLTNIPISTNTTTINTVKTVNINVPTSNVPISAYNTTITTPVPATTGYFIERSIDNSNFISVTHVPLNQYEFTDVSVIGGNTYYYRIKKVSNIDESEYSLTKAILYVTSNPPTITLTNISKSKISDETGMDVCTVTFQSDQNLLQWEARADGTGNGSGLLVGSGGVATANSDISFNIDNEELTLGDKQYKINIYGQNEQGVWTTYV